MEVLLPTNAFITRIDQLSSLRRSRIALGLAQPDEKVLKHLLSAQEIADIVLVGPSALSNSARFEAIVDNDPEQRIVSLLVDGSVDGIIRGTLDDFITREHYSAQSGVEFDVEPVLLETPSGDSFFVTPVSNPDGWDRDRRLALATGAARFLRDWGLEPEIAVFSPVRAGTFERTRDSDHPVTRAINAHHEDASSIAQALEQQGFNARNWGIDLDKSVATGCNILVPVSGVVGNQIVRSVLLCGGRILAAPCLGLPHCYEDNSRNETDFVPHVRWLNAWINSRRAQHNE